MTWNVNATKARGHARALHRLLHSNGNGGAPVVIPIGRWRLDAGSCGNATRPPPAREHNKHVNGENLACTVCHNPANSATHMNGARTPSHRSMGQRRSVTVTKNACTGGDPSCFGRARHNHNNQCW